MHAALDSATFFFGAFAPGARLHSVPSVRPASCPVKPCANQPTDRPHANKQSRRKQARRQDSKNANEHPHAHAQTHPRKHVNTQPIAQNFEATAPPRYNAHGSFVQERGVQNSPRCSHENGVCARNSVFDCPETERTFEASLCPGVALFTPFFPTGPNWISYAKRNCTNF